MARGGAAAPTLPGTAIKPPAPAPTPPAACLALNADAYVNLGTDVRRTVATPVAPVHAACPDAFIADFEAAQGAQGVNVRPQNTPPQSWLDTFSLSIWDAHEILGGDSLKLTNIANAKICANVKQSIYIYKKAVPAETAFTQVAGGELRPEWYDNACWLRRPFTNFRGHAGSTTVKNIYRVVFTSPGGVAGPINVSFAHDGTSNPE